MGLRRSLASWALRICGTCAFCLESCSGTKARRLRVLNFKGDEDGKQNVVDLWNGAALANDIVAKLWPYVSEWFRIKLKTELEPVLKRALYEIVNVQFESLGLGTVPLRLYDVQTSTCDEVFEGESCTSIKITGNLDYKGDGAIVVGVRAGGGSMGRVELLKLEMSGRLVVEFARLTPDIPWFSGIHIYFPDVPKVDLEVGSKVFFLDALMDTTSLVKSKVLSLLQDAIAQTIVLPNRLSLEAAQGADPFQLKQARPEGILRTQVELQTPSANDAAAASGEEGTWSSWLWGSSAKAADFSRLQICLGAHCHTCGSGEVLDHYVYDRQEQSLSIASAAEPGQVLAIVAVDTIMKEQRPTGTSGEDDESAGNVCSIPLSFGQTKAMLRAQWRPLATRGYETLVEDGDSCWDVGPKRGSGWILFLDIFHAIGLPGAGVQEGTQHWVAVSVHKPGRKDPLAQEESKAEAAHTPARHGLEALQRRGALQNLEGVGAVAGTDDERYIMELIPQQAWRLLLGRAVQGKNLPANSLDCIWMQPCTLLMGGGESLADALEPLELHVDVMRPENGVEKVSGGRNRSVGFFKFELRHLLAKARYTEEMTANLQGARDEAGQLKIRVEARPLLAAPGVDPEEERSSLIARVSCLVRSYSMKADEESARLPSRSLPSGVVRDLDAATDRYIETSTTRRLSV